MCTEIGYHAQLTDFTVPEIQNGDMLQECLDIIRIGRNPITFSYMSPPATETVIRALGIHLERGTLTMSPRRELALTSRGEHVSMLPVNAFSAVALLESSKYGCCDEMVMLVSMIEAIEGGNILFKNVENDPKIWAAITKTKSNFGKGFGDHIMLFNIYLSWREARHKGTTVQWLQDCYMVGSTLKLADTVRNQLLRILWRNQHEFN